MSRYHMTPKEREERRQLLEAYDKWCASPESVGHNRAVDPFPLFRTAFEAGRLEAELEHLGLERITVSSVVLSEADMPDTPEQWVVHRGQTYRKKRTKT